MVGRLRQRAACENQAVRAARRSHHPRGPFAFLAPRSQVQILSPRQMGWGAGVRSRAAQRRNQRRRGRRGVEEAASSSRTRARSSCSSLSSAVRVLSATSVSARRRPFSAASASRRARSALRSGCPGSPVSRGTDPERGPDNPVLAPLAVPPSSAVAGTRRRPSWPSSEGRVPLSIRRRTALGVMPSRVAASSTVSVRSLMRACSALPRRPLPLRGTAAMVKPGHRGACGVVTTPDARLVPTPINLQPMTRRRSLASTAALPGRYRSVPLSAFRCPRPEGTSVGIGFG